MVPETHQNPPLEYLIQSLSSSETLVSTFRGSTLKRLLVLAIAVTLPIVVFAVVSLASQLPDFFNPCMKWGISSESTLIVSQAGPCTIASGTSETIPQAMLRLTLIQGGILFAFCLGILGVVRSRPTFLMAASAILFLESVPFVFDGLFVLTLPPAAVFLWASKGRNIFSSLTNRRQSPS